MICLTYCYQKKKFQRGGGDTKKEYYQFTWPDKSESIRFSNTQTTNILRPCKDESVNFDTTENLYIEGDNLEVLKILRETYLNKVKVIYIDPPYNTGNDFIYNDSFNENLDNYKERTTDRDENSNILSLNKESNGRFHTNWLNMIYPRLLVAKDLLKNDGIIFISIDDNECFNLKKVCDEIFGESNFISCIALEITKTQGMKVRAAKDGSIVKNHEYILCYSKYKQNKIVKNILYNRNDGYDTHYSLFLQENDGKLSLDSLVDVINNTDEFKDILCKYNYQVKSIKDIEKLIILDKSFKNKIYTSLARNICRIMDCAISIPDEIKNSLQIDGILQYKDYYLIKVKEEKILQLAFLKDSLAISDEYNSDYERVTIRGSLWKGFYSDMMNIAKEGKMEYKNGKKPVRLIKQLIKWIGCCEDDIVLDFFSGSATTAHAVMQLNSEDKGNRKFIMIQIEELITDKSLIAYHEGYKTICDIGKERIRRAGSLIKENSQNKDLDIGFRVLKVDSPNIEDTSITPNELQKGQTEFLFKETTVKEGRTSLDLLFQVLLRLKIELSTKFERKIIDDCEVFYVKESFLIACFDENINDDIIMQIAKDKPDYFVTCDHILTDSLRDNINQHFDLYSKNTIVKVL